MSFAKKLVLLLFLTALLNGPARAQQAGTQQADPQQPGTPDQPQPPAAAEQPTTPANSKTQATVPVVRSLWGLDAPATITDPDAYIPDSHPLTGAAALTAGEPESHVNLFDMSLNLAFSGDTGLLNSANQFVLGTQSVVGGDLDYAHTWHRNSFAATYDGGETFFDPSSTYYGSGMFHSLSLGEQIAGGRWVLRLTNDFLYSTNADVGGDGMAGPGLLGDFGGPFAGLNPDFGGAGETILTGPGRRVNNSSIGEVEYDLSPHSAVTVTGLSDLLHFFDAGYIDNRNYLGRVGYDLGVSPKSTVAFYAQVGRTTYNLISTGGAGPGGAGTPLIPFGITEYGGGIGFSHSLTGRVAFQIEGGPDVEVLSSNSISNSSNRWIWDVNTSVSYQFQRSSLSISYFHGPTQGAGVYAGSSSHVVTGAYTRRFTRFFSANLNGGYTRNNALVSAVGFANEISNWYVGGNLNRQLGRSLDFTIYYGAQKQITGGVCPVAGCALMPVRQTFGIGLAWHPKTIALE
jgi:hypothetical protein